MVDQLRASARVAALPLAGLGLLYVLAVLTPVGRALDSQSLNGRIGTDWSVRVADRMLLETISVATLALALAALVVLGGLRGRWQLGLRNTAAVIGAQLSVETLKIVLPSKDRWSGEWNLLNGGSFPSGHSVIVTSITLALLTISADRWRRLLVGPLVALTALMTTATVTLGWHRPSDVLGSLLLVTAWHRAVNAGQPDERPLRALLPRPAGARTALAGWTDRMPTLPTAVWWAGACTLILGAALEGALAGARYGSSLAVAIYLCSLAVLLAAVLVTIAAAPRPAAQRPAAQRPFTSAAR